IVALGQTQLAGFALETDDGPDIVDFLPRDSDNVHSKDSGAEDALCDGPQRSWQPPVPHAGAAEDRREARRLAGTSLELEVIDAPAAAPIDVDELVVQETVDEIHPRMRHQIDPPSVTSIRGIAAR